MRLARVGFDNVEGYLKGGFDAWKNAGEPIDIIIEVDADELGMDIPFDDNLNRDALEAVIDSGKFRCGSWIPQV